MRNRNIHTIRTDTMLRETGFYYPTPAQERAALRVNECRSLSSRVERMLIGLQVQS